MDSPQIIDFQMVEIDDFHTAEIGKILGFNATQILREESENLAFNVHDSIAGFYVSRVDIGWDQKRVFVILFMVSRDTNSYGDGFHKSAFKDIRKMAKKFDCARVQTLPHIVGIGRGLMRDGYKETAREYTLTLDSE